MAINTASQRTARHRRYQARIGQPTKNDYLNRVITGLNNTPAASKVITVTVTDPGDGVDIAYAILDADGDVIASLTTNTGTGNGANEIAALIAIDINADADARGLVSAESSTNTVIVTGGFPGFDFGFDDSSASLSEATTTAAAEAADIPFGVGCLLLSIPQDAQPTSGYNRPDYMVGRASNALLTAQADVLTPLAVNDATYHVTVEVDGLTYVASTTADASATVKEIVEALVAVLNGILPANTVVATEDDAAITLTSELAGKPFKVGAGSNAAGATWTHTTNAGLLTDINKALLGVAHIADDNENATISATEAVYPANAGVKILECGFIAVENSQGVSLGQAVYIELDSGSANRGKFFNSSSSTRVLLEGYQWVRSLTPSGAAEMQFNGALS